MRRKAAVLAALVALGCGRPSRLADLGARQEALRAVFHQKVAHDPVLAEALADEGDVLVALRGRLLQGMMREVAQRYLDRVELDLPLGARVQADGEVKAKRLGLTVNAGRWTLDLVIHRVRGVLRAGEPKVGLPEGERLSVELPVSLQQARGTATVHFRWDARGIANLACRDFAVTRTLAGEVAPDVYTVKGALVLTAQGERLLARPEFSDRRFRLRVSLTARSWQQIQQALDEQDKLLKCGLALDPEDMTRRVGGRLAKGFNVRLPASLFREVALPASLRGEVEAEGRRLAVRVRPRSLRLAEDTLWYSAEARVTVPEGSGGGSR